MWTLLAVQGAAGQKHGRRRYLDYSLLMSTGNAGLSFRGAWDCMFNVRCTRSTKGG